MSATVSEVAEWVMVTAESKWRISEMYNTRERRSITSLLFYKQNGCGCSVYL